MAGDDCFGAVDCQLAEQAVGFVIRAGGEERVVSPAGLRAVAELICTD
jgi:hypothetical protein